MLEPKPKLPRSVLILNIAMILLILAICALVVNLVYSPAILGAQTAASTAAATASEAEVQTQEAEASAPPQSTTSVSMTKRSTSGASESLPENNEPGYDKENFKNDLFIGDSITTGLHLYNKLDIANVAASVGYTPYGAYSKYCDHHNTTALEYAISMKPDRIFVMLGSNALPPTASTEKHYEQLVDRLKSSCPNSEICCISVTPISENADTDVTNDMVTEFNDVIKNICQQKDIVYLDFHSVMMGADGYADPELLAQDGVHFKSETYDILLKFIEDNIS